MREDDAADADARRFLTHLVAAVRVCAPEVGAAALLEGERTVRAEDVLAGLVDDLDALAGQTVVAFDDYHVIDSADVHQAVSFMLDNLPPRVTVAMTTRSDPPLPLSRLRARGDLLEVRADDLRFTTAEATTFLNDVMGLLWLSIVALPRALAGELDGAFVDVAVNCSLLVVIAAAVPWRHAWRRLSRN